jgi:acetolactate synthase-1/2/3 large subunit
VQQLVTKLDIPVRQVLIEARIVEASDTFGKSLGVRLGEMTTQGYSYLAAPRPAQKLVHIHAGAEELGRVYQADLMLQAGVCCGAKSLEALAAPTQVPWQAQAAAARADYEANLVAPPVQPLDMAVLIKALQRLLPDSTVYTNGAGNFSGWLHRYCSHPGLQHHGRTQLAPSSGAMGYGLPAAVAAALLQPERWAVNIAGDGDFLMNGQELATATGYGAKRLLSVVVDNGTYGTIRMHQEREYPARVSGSDLFNPDFAALARAYGWRGEFIDTTAAIEPALVRAIEAGVPTLLHVKLAADVITSRTTLSAIRHASAQRPA